ncbi:hypothetical protein D9758_012513 [Tetrapyrgos nigripes]|uniref:Helitron helicase-like domain-containing protein n=1 Tax=Tetrapyrgos nigripes TaxID=182062 RepID=A0A8H5G350_9AGAR|nr:hypothetical protein D9758_012513 [Tetrapyrgos nigripes]
MTLPDSLRRAAAAGPVFLALTVENLCRSLQQLSLPDLHYIHSRIDYTVPNKQGKRLRALSIAKFVVENLAVTESSLLPAPAVHDYHAKCMFLDRRLGEGFCRMFGEKMLYTIIRSGIYDYDGPQRWLITHQATDFIKNSFESQDDLSRLVISIPVNMRVKYDDTEYHIQTQDFRGQSNSLSTILSRFFTARLKILFSLSDDDLAQVFLFYFPGTQRNSFDFEDRDTVVLKILTGIFGPITDILFDHATYDDSSDMQALRVPTFDQPDLYRLDYLQERQRWPEFVPLSTILHCLSTYRQKSVYVYPRTCGCCACDDSDYSGADVPVSQIPSLTLLKCRDPFILAHVSPERFQYVDRSLNGTLLEKKSIVQTDKGFTIYLCKDCHSSLLKSKLPVLSLVNCFYRGELPADLLALDITWAEEMVCALYHTTVLVIRLYGSVDEDQPRVLHGNASAFELNTVSTANVLPWTPNDLNGTISVVFVGPKKMTLPELRQIKQLYVRRSVVWKLLNFFFLHNRLYMNLPPPSAEILNMYPENDILPGLQERVIYDLKSDAASNFDQESSSFSEHPSAQFMKPATAESETEPFSESRQAILERHGVHDPECTKIPARSMISSALANIRTDRDRSIPDLAIHHSYSFVSEYNNPDLICGMFPTLFPLGVGGFENRDRKPYVAFDKQANYYLYYHDRSFRYHYTFLFVVFNIMQRRIAHLGVHMTTTSQSLFSVANTFASLSSQSLEKLAKRIEKEGYLQTMSPEEKLGFQLLRKVNTVAARIPGSQSAKVHTRNEIRSYFGYFGLPQLFFTFNPCAVHSPIFQVIFGDRSVNLDQMYPKLVSRYERACRIARDPVAGADFFQFSFQTAFRYLLGWDFDKRCSTEEGGIFGKIRAFYGTLEHTERGEFHGHFEIFLVGGLNPTETHAKMRIDPTFERRFCDFFDQLIWHHLPNIEYREDKNVEP